MEKYFMKYRNKFMKEYTCGELIVDDNTPDMKTLVNGNWINVIDMARACLTLIFENFQNSRESKLEIFNRLSIEDVKAYICKEYARGVLKLCSEICADGSIEAFEFANFGLTIYLIDMLMKNGKVIEIENEERHYIFPNFAVDDHTKLNIYFDCTELSEVNVRCEVLEAD